MHRLVVLLLALVFTHVAVAPESVAQDMPVAITFDEAMRIAMENSPALLRAALAVEASEDAVSMAQANFLPSLMGSASGNRSFGLTFDQTTGSLQQTTVDGLSASLSASVNLFNGFRDVSELERRRLERLGSEYQMRRAQEDVVFMVASQFLTIVLNRDIVEIRREALEAQQVQRDQIVSLVELGMRPNADLLQQDALVAEAELSVLQAENALELAETEMIRLLQLDPALSYDFIAPTLGETSLFPEQVTLHELLNAAYERRIDLRSQDIAIEAAEVGVRSARSGYYPTLSLGGSFGSGYSSAARRLVEGPGIVTEPIPFGDQFFRENRSGSIGISLNVPIFDRFFTRSQVRSARMAVRNEEIRRDELRQEIAVQVRQAYLDYQNVEMRLDVTARRLLAAEAALDAEQVRYDEGVSTLAELAQARARYVEAASSRAQAVAEFHFQRRRLEYTSGLLDLQPSLFD